MPSHHTDDVTPLKARMQMQTMALAAATAAAAAKLGGTAEEPAVSAEEVDTYASGLSATQQGEYMLLV
jgi:hypothetical protein